MTINCATCNRQFEGYSTFVTPHCPDCQQRQAAARAQAEVERRQARRVREWQSLCPPAFDLIDRARLPDPSLLDQVLAWRFGPTGLLLHGETGRGKTRCACQLLRREHFDGRRVFIVDALSLADHPKRLLADSADASAWVNRASGCELLLLDDPFKVTFTPRVEEAVFLIVDHRLAHGLPVIATTNDTGETLAARLSPDRGPALIRRIRESTRDIAA